MPERLAVPLWPAVVEFGTARLTALLTPETGQRSAARAAVRSALRQLLAEHYACPAARFIETPGEALRVADQPFSIAISHESGLSLLAVQPAGRLGIDLMRLDAAPADAAERQRLAREYLSDAAAAVSADRAAFAQAWTAHEASLKCLGLPLSEAAHRPVQHDAGLLCHPLDLPAPYVGTLAYQPQN